MRHHATDAVRDVRAVGAVAPVRMHVRSPAARLWFNVVRAHYQRGLRAFARRRAASGPPPR